MGAYNTAKHNQVMVHADTKTKLMELIPRLKVKTYNQVVQILIASYDKTQGKAVCN